jgi:arylamine N-acetyltransferase
MIDPQPTLADSLLSEILLRLGLPDRPLPADLAGLQKIYGAWCQRVPFDNIRKRIHLAHNRETLLPGADPVDFFRGWLDFGCGGTCWAGADALHTLLRALGFTAYRTIATMQVSTRPPPNHGSVVAVCAGQPYLVDSSMLHQEPLLINQEQGVALPHPAWGLRGFPQNGEWWLHWRPLHRLSGCFCQINRIGASRATFIDFNERTRKSGPFNHSLYLRINRGAAVIGVAEGHRLRLDRDGVERLPLEKAAQDRLLGEEFGIDPQLVAQIPPPATGQYRF